MQAKIQILPVGWERLKLKDIAKVSQGLQIAISERFQNDGNNRVHYITIPYIEGKKIEYIENPSKSVQCDYSDILVVRTGSGVGKIIKGVKGAFHNNFFKIKETINTDINFLYYFLISKKTQFLMNVYAGASAIPDINHGDFYSIDILLPPIQEQTKIAQVLAAWDEAIIKQEELIKEKEQLQKGLTQKLLDGEVRVIDAQRKKFAAWKQVRLKEITIQNPKSSLNVNSSISKGKYPFYTSGDTVNASDHYIVDGLNLLMNDGGVSGIKYYSGKCSYSNHTLSFQGNKHANTMFIYYSIQSRLREIDIKFFVGTGLKNLAKTDFFKFFYINLPCMDEQDKIVEILDLVDKEINLLNKELEEFKIQKKGLMQKLLTGEVRVKA